MVVHELEDVHAALGHHGEPSEVHDHAGAGEDEQAVDGAPLLGPGVHDDGDDGLHQGELSPKSQGQQHYEEEQCPDLGTGKKGDSLRVDDEGQPGTYKEKRLAHRLR